MGSDGSLAEFFDTYDFPEEVRGGHHPVRRLVPAGGSRSVVATRPIPMPEPMGFEIGTTSFHRYPPGA